MPSVTDGGDQAFCVGKWSMANRVGAIGQSLHNQIVLTLVERMSIDMFVLTPTHRAQSSIEIRFSSLKRLSVMFIYYLSDSLMPANGNRPADSFK